MEHSFTDNADGEIEIKLPLPLEVAPCEASKLLKVESKTKSLKVFVNINNETSLLINADPLYDKVYPDETTWFVDDKSIIITLSKASDKTWPYLTIDEELSNRVAPIKLSSDKSNDSTTPKDSAGAFAARSKVERLLKAAKEGRLDDFKSACIDLSEGKPIQEVVSHIKDANGRTALHFAAIKGQTEMLEYILSELKLDVNARDDEGETPLLFAIRERHLDAATCLLQNGADPLLSSEKSGSSAIHHAAGNGSSELIQLLVKHGCDVNMMSDAGPPLIYACGHAHMEAAKTLLSLGADPNLTNEDGVNALLTAAAAGETEIVQVLVQHGAEVNGSAGGVSPLFIACNEGSNRMIIILLEAGADPNQKDDEGCTPIQAAASQGHEEAVKLLFPVTKPDPNLKVWSVESILRTYEQTNTYEESKDENILSTTGESKDEEGNHSLNNPSHSHSQNQNLSNSEIERKKKMASESKGRGDDAFKKKDFSQALDSYSQAIELDPSDAKLFSNRSLCWLRLGQADMALSDSQIARKLAPDWPKACYREGSALMCLQKFEDAANVFFEGVQLDPNNVELAKAFQEAILAGKKAHAELNSASS